MVELSTNEEDEPVSINNVELEDISTKTEIVEFCCESCGMVGTSKDMKAHMGTHQEWSQKGPRKKFTFAGVFNCDSCDNVFNSRELLQNKSANKFE